MDSLTQIALGAAVGEAVVGRQAGWRGAAWGAALGTLPDLDILAYPFLDSVGQLAFHRGFSHSILFAVLAAPLFGALLARLHRSRGVPLRQWSLAAGLIIGTHILLDCFTVYGTQVFRPFSDYPLSFNSLFIIDPAYTVPLVLGVLVALFLRRESKGRRRANTLGLALSTAYILWSLVAKGVAHDAFERGWAASGIAVERSMSNPMPFNTLLWMGIAESRDTLHVGVYSLLDDVPPTRFLTIPKRSELVAPFENERAMARLLSFSKGWYSVAASDGGLILDDVRFGRSDGWMTDAGTPIFRFRLNPGDCPDRWCSFEQVTPELADPAESLRSLFDRISSGPALSP